MFLLDHNNLIPQVQWRHRAWLHSCWKIQTIRILIQWVIWYSMPPLRPVCLCLSHFVCLCRWTHPLESDWQHYDRWGHFHGLQRWPLSVRYSTQLLSPHHPLGQPHRSDFVSFPRIKCRIQIRFFTFDSRLFTVVSAEVEMTAYGLLTYTLLGDVASALPVVKWLSQQRNALGGFSSTQVALFLWLPSSFGPATCSSIFSWSNKIQWKIKSLPIFSQFTLFFW